MAIVLAATTVAKGRVALLMLGLVPHPNSSPEVEYAGFVASPRKFEDIVNHPRITTRLRRQAEDYAIELVTDCRLRHSGVQRTEK